VLNAISNRSDYPCLLQTNYLNQASLGLIGQAAVSQMHEFLDKIARHGNLKMSDEEEASFADPLRKKASQLLNCPVENLAIVSSASEILSQLPQLFAIKSGSKILVISSDFPAITRPWIAYSQKTDCELKFIDEHANENLTEQIVQNIDKNTAAVCVSHVQFSTGTQLDIKKIRQVASKFGARLVIDVTQAAGAVPISANDWQADILVCSGYKWLGGHGGVALAVISSELLKELPPSPGWFGGDNPFDMTATLLPLSKTAKRYTQATMSYISIVGLTASISELLEIGVPKIFSHSQEMAKLLKDGLTNSQWTTHRPTQDKSVSSHIITLVNESSNISQTVQNLKEQKVFCGVRNGRLRISLAHYNDESDINALLSVLS
jgi:selenocysteine lyase/cysteine desulfurase